LKNEFLGRNLQKRPKRIGRRRKKPIDEQISDLVRDGIRLGMRLARQNETEDEEEWKEEDEENEGEEEGIRKKDETMLMEVLSPRFLSITERKGHKKVRMDGRGCFIISQF
jgi:hypothetical protein